MVVLEGLRMRSERRPYTDALHAVLIHRGWFRGSKAMLSGMTVTGFRFTVNRRLTAESATAYNWHSENFLAADFTGMTSSQHMGFVFQPTWPLYRELAIAEIKASIDRGAGAVFWHGEFVVAAGYDDERSVLYYSDGRDSQLRELPYERFGNNGTPYWYYQIIEGRIPMDEHAIVKESFLQAIFKWETHDLALPERGYACGRAAYDAIVTALRSGDYDRDGARETFATYAAFKRDLAEYTAGAAGVRSQAAAVTREVDEHAAQRAGAWPEVAAAAECYGEVSRLFERIAAEPGLPDAERILLFEAARQAEEQAIAALKALVRETADNRYHDIGLR
ncbi:hypothetical protein COLU111180_13310 [Cohnella lubricantis]